MQIGSIARTWPRLTIAGALLALAAACTTIRLAEIPAPRRPCPTAEDERRLAELLPDPEDDVELALEVDRLGRRFVDAAVYCRLAQRRLAGPP